MAEHIDTAELARERGRKRANAWYWANRERALSYSKTPAVKKKHNQYREKNKEKCVRLTREWAHKNPGVYLFHNAKSRAKKRGVPFNIERSDVVIPAVCPVLGIPIEATVRGRRGFHPNSPSIDCIVPALGYVKGNIMVISNIANTLKRTEVTPERLRQVADYIEREVARVRAGS